MLRSTLQVGFAAVVLTLATACSDPLALDIVAVDVTGDLLVSPDNPATFRVSAVNRSRQRVVWGMGSSSCQLGLVVHVSANERHRIDHRACTADLVEQGLDPGRSRTEAFTWGGEVLEGNEMRVLDPGRYGVVGVAGDKGESGSITVTVIVN